MDSASISDGSADGIAVSFPLCRYVNRTDRVQILRISDCSHYCYERVVFPGCHQLLTAPADANLEIYSGDPITCMLLDRVSCAELIVADIASVGSETEAPLEKRVGGGQSLSRLQDLRRKCPA
jgi:hypothetical protein